MKRWALPLALAFWSLTCAAHLNHVQFAAVEEINGQMRIRFRFSADMFMSNLEADIKAGRMDASAKNAAVSDLIARYTKGHLQLETGEVRRDPVVSAFTFDE